MFSLHPTGEAHQANCGAHPRAVMIKPLDTVVVYRAVVGPRGLVKVTSVVIPDDDPLGVYQNFF